MIKQLQLILQKMKVKKCCKLFEKNKIFWSEQLRILLQSIVNVIQQVICQEVDVEKQISDQLLVNLLDNKAGGSQHRLSRRSGVSQSIISRHLKK